MPPDLLMIAFALTLAINAVFVIVAIRALRRGRFGSNGSPLEREVPSLPPERASARRAGGESPEVVRAVAARRAALADREDVSVRQPGAAIDPAPEASADGSSGSPTNPAPDSARAAPSATLSATPIGVPERAGPDVDPPAEPAGAAEAPASPPAESAAAPPAPAAARPKPATGRGKGRRKFSLPPLDDDHEKVSRSIQSFLDGGDPTADGSPADSGTAGGSATTVALIAIVGPGDDDVDDAPAVAMVERTLRSAARGTDVVAVEDRGRFRIVLNATGELAARAYLRRVRATVEPLLQAADTPLRLAIATATVLDEPIDAAATIAARRLELAVAAIARGDDGDGSSRPRAAAD